MSCPANHILYEGSRGPGKTDAQLMAFRKNVGMGYGAAWNGVIFDREYKNLDDLIAKSLRWFPQFRDGARFLQSKSDYKWVWPTGETLAIRQIKRATDYWKYHGQEFAFIGWNELTKFPTAELYDAMMSCNRTSFINTEHSPDLDNPLPPIPLVVFSTTNPYGPGHGWVKRRFIDPAPAGKMIRTTRKVFNPQTQQEEEITKTQVRLFGSYRENRYLAPEYVLELDNIKDKNKRRAWLQGDWNIVAGGAFDDLWDETIHVIPRFVVPPGWYVDRSLDWGASKPFSVGFWALANGEDATLPDGRKFCPPRGSLIRCGEFYGCDPNTPNVGLNMSAKAVAQGTLQIEANLLAHQWLLRRPLGGPADNSINDESRKGVDSIALEMANEGVRWTNSDKSPGSRKRGLQLARDRFENALTGEGPGLYIMDHCRNAIAQIPTLPRDPDDTDDVDTEAEDHLWDEMRYRVLAGAQRQATEIEVQFAT